MLWCWTSLLSLLCLTKYVTAQCQAGPGKTQSGNNNYVIDYYTDTFLLSYAVDKCTAVSIIDGTVFYKFTCTLDDNDVWWITKTNYATSDCSDAGSLVGTWNNEAISEGEVGYFKCDGENSYTEIAMGLDNECLTALPVFGGLGSCASNPSTLDTKFYCYSTSAKMLLYNPSANTTYDMCDDTHLYCNQWSFTPSCTPVGQIFGMIIYGYVADCSVQETLSPTAAPVPTPIPTANPTIGAEPTKIPTMSPTPPPTPTPNTPTEDEASSASSQFVLLGIVVSLVMSLFH